MHPEIARNMIVGMNIPIGVKAGKATEDYDGRNSERQINK